MRLLTLFRVSSRILEDSERGRMLGTTPLLDRDIGSGHGRGTDLPVRPGGGVGLTDHALPTVPVRADASCADRHPIHPDRERADSRSRRALGHTPKYFSFPKQGCG